MSKLRAIMAVNNLGYIGKDGKLMWRSSADFKHFKEMTKGSICIVGRKTFDMDLGGKPLKDRIMIVVGGTNNYPVGVHLNETLFVVKRLFTAVANAILLSAGQNLEIWVIGGATIYEQLMPLIDELHISVINDDQVGDTKVSIPDNFRGEKFYYNFEVNKQELI